MSTRKFAVILPPLIHCAFELADCQTCYLIYLSNPAHSPRPKGNTNAKTNKQLVYEFQRELDAKESNERRARSDEGEKMVDINELKDSTPMSPDKERRKSMKISIPKSPGVKVDRQPPTPHRPLH